MSDLFKEHEDRIREIFNSSNSYEDEKEEAYEKPLLIRDINIIHPPHYQGKNFEAINVIEDFNLNFNLGNAIKYILRCDKKGNKKQDLQKAKWYLERECANAAEETVN